VADAELAAIAAGRRAGRGSPEAAEQCLRLAERGMAWVPGTRRAQADLLLGIARLLLARQRGDLPAVAEQAQRKQDAAEAAQPGLGRGGVRAGMPGLTYRRYGPFRQAERLLGDAARLARRVGRP
jgi:LuxR family transcriptional regulator, maltose regulon positive regulatory protein